MLHTKRDYFQQSEPSLRGKNVVTEDHTLRDILKRCLPPSAFDTIYQDLTPFGTRVTGDIMDLAERIEQPNNYPRLVSYNGWGRRIDEIITCHEWKALHDVAADAGIIGLGYERSLGKYSRVHQYSKLYYFEPVSGLVTCPLAMTDGAARLIEQVRKEKAASPDTYSYPPFLDTIYERLTSREKSKYWTSGQWMTEKTGGSDVSQSETVAEHVSGNKYKLYGYKYFTSATTADVTFTLARVSGTKQLSLFVVKLRDGDGKLNNMLVHRLKDKLGTKTLPTAEIELIGTDAELIGEVEKGVKTISHLFNVTRIWTVTSSAASINVLLALHRDYASKRKAFGYLLKDLPAHILTMSRIEVEARACSQLFIKMALLLGEDECEPNTKTSQLLRLMTPVCKLFTAKQAMEVAQEALECFGAAGYMEDSGLPRVLRDAQVNTIWEGTTNILSLDTLRAMQKDSKAVHTFAEDVQKNLEGTKDPLLLKWCGEINKILDSLKKYSLTSRQQAEFCARDFAFTLGRVYAASLLIAQANWSQKVDDVHTVDIWCTLKPLSYIPFALITKETQDVAKVLARL